jgi:peptide/nickel transport system substrate-binding protein
MNFYNHTILAAIGAIALSIPVPEAKAQGRTDVLIALGEQGPNSLDTMTPTSNDYTRLIAWNVYDRLVSHGTTTLEDGSVVYDKDNIIPELATHWEVTNDGTEMIFYLRQDATFHDGSLVEAKDVKWSFDRAVAAGGFPLIQMGAGSLTDPAQFEAVDANTFRVTVPDGNKLALPDIAVPIPSIFNMDLALEHATTDDPWANEWLKNNTAGGGAYRIDRWNPGNEIVFSRFDDWKNGPLPAMNTVVYRQVASAGTRRALLERGDADISIDLPPKDFAELENSDDITVVGVAKQSALVYLELNTLIPPFDNQKVREAIAYAIPYQAIMDNAYYGRGIPMFGATPGEPFAATWPVPSPYYTDLERARELLAEAGYPNGFETELFLDLSQATTREPAALMIQENLKAIGITTTVEKVPGANWFSKLLEKSMPMVLTSFHAWLDYPEYHFYWTYHGGNNSVFNAASYISEPLDTAIDNARFETDPAAYEQEIIDFVDIAMKDLPKIPIVQDFTDVAMQPNVDGYVYWFHSLLDFRSITKD